MNGGFTSWGRFVARRPCSVITGTLILSLLLMSRLFMARRNPLPTETRTEKLWVPQNCEAMEDKERYEEAFGLGSRRNSVYFTSASEGGNVLTAAVLSEVARFDTMVRNDLYAEKYGTRSMAELEPTSPVYYADVCVRSSESVGCSEGGAASPLSLFQLADGGFNLSLTDAQIAAVVSSGRGLDAGVWPAERASLQPESVFGSVGYGPGGQVESAEAVRRTGLEPTRAALRCPAPLRRARAPLAGASDVPAAAVRSHRIA